MTATADTGLKTPRIKFTAAYFLLLPLFASRSNVEPQGIFGGPLHSGTAAATCSYLGTASKHPTVILPLGDETRKKKMGRMEKTQSSQGGEL